MIIVAGALSAGYAVFMLALMRREQVQRNTHVRWLVLALLAGVLSIGTTLLPADAHRDPAYEALFVGALNPPALTVIALNLLLVLFGYHLLRYLHARIARLWFALGVGWWVAQAAMSITADHLTIGTRGWYRHVYEPVVWPNTLAVGGWLVLGVLLVLAALYAFYRAHLPEIANRALFGALLVLPLFAGVALATSGESVLAETGWLLQFAGLAGAVYSVSVHRVLDVRRTFRQVAATGILTALTALVIFVALVIGQGLEPGTEGAYTILAALALGVAVVYIPLRAAVQPEIERLIGAAPEHISRKLHRFSEDISGAVELDQVVDVTMHTLAQTLRVRHSGLILITENETTGALLLEPVTRGMSDMPELTGTLAPDSPLYAHFARQRAPLLQYDLDYASAFASTPEAERQFFQALHMGAYAPIVVQRQLIGLLCCGAKASDDAFTERDLELLRTIANQTGVAVRNARLVADLRRREAEQAELNKALSATKERLERLDSVKTDFITIASHELRTPLAQIRGYTDIMEAMNEQGVLDQDEVGGMTANIRKAADRLEELIGAMLDVSQIDVNAMDLRFNPVSVESAMRTAIEPLTEAIKNRRLMLAARGLRDLPPIQGDQQRLVQAFRNVVLNAIKYTPDGGRIDIKGRLQDDTILIAIKDSGIGIDPQNHDLIFEKFFRAHDPSLHSTGATKFMGAGPGLGLTIARGVITAHGGRIWVESTRHDPESMPGSTFYIALPLEPPVEATRVAPFESTVSLNGGARNAPDVPPPQFDAAPTMPKPPAGLRR